MRIGNLDNSLMKAQAALDREQIAFLGKDPSRGEISSWFNACLNSACGPVADKYGHVAVEILLMSWLGTVRKKASGPENPEVSQ